VHDSEGGPDAPIDLLDRRAFVREVDPHLTRLFWGGDIEREQPEEQQKVEAQIVMESAVPRLENGAGRLLGSDGEDIDKPAKHTAPAARSAIPVRRSALMANHKYTPVVETNSSK